MPCPSRIPIEPDCECLLHPLHYLRQLESVIGPDIEYEPLALKTESTNLEGEESFCLTEDPEEKGCGLPEPEERFAVVDCCPYFVPCILRQNSFLPHAVYMG